MEKENKKNKIIKRLLIAFLIIIIICVIATLGIGNYFVNYAIARTGDGGNREVKNEDAVEVASIDNESERIIEENREKEDELAEKWAENISNTKVEIKANDGITLRGTKYIIEEQNEKAEIILHGSSMGAATVLMASGDDLPENVKAIIADSGYTSVWDIYV